LSSFGANVLTNRAGNMNQRLIQFDVRLHKADYLDAYWDNKQRDSFLLRPDIEWPLSVDSLVWPSVFFSRIFADVAELQRGSIEVAPETDDGKYWLNLEQMKSHYEAHKKSGGRGVGVGIHVFSENSLTGDVIPYTIKPGIACAMILGNTVPSECPADSELLGYDVADASRISGLSNCGYTPDELEQLRPLWVPRINGFGLLTTLQDAVEFRELCDTRVPEHSPFWVYDIWRLPP